MRLWGLGVGSILLLGCKGTKDDVDGLYPDGSGHDYIDYTDYYIDYIDGTDMDGGYWDYYDSVEDYSDYAYDAWWDSYGDSWWWDTPYDFVYDSTDYPVDYVDCAHTGFETGETGESGETGLGTPGIDDLSPGELVVTEIMHNPSSVLDTSGEWFEVINLSTFAVNLDGLVVRDEANTERFVVAGVLVVDPMDRVVFGVDSDLGTNGGVPVDIVYLVSDFVLANGADQIVLENGIGILDEVSYDDGVTFPDVDGATMSLDPARTSAAENDLGDAWCAAVAAYGAGDLGTPGDPNPSCPVSSTGETGLSMPADDIAVGELVITEIMNNPAAVLDTRGEWFELRNVGARPLDLEGLQVSNAAGTESFIVEGTLMLAASAQVVLGIESDTALNGGATVGYEYVGFSLGNGADEIIISNRTGTLDSISYDGGTSFPNPSGASLSLDPPSTDPAANDSGASWCEATTAFGAGDRGTPSSPNDPC